MRWSVLALMAVAVCARAENVTAQQELSAAIDLLKAYHINRDKADWPAIETQAAARLGEAKKPTDAYPAIRFVISELRVRHTFLMPADSYQAMIAGKRVGDAAPPNPDMPDARLPARGIALLHLPWFQGNEAQGRAYVAAARNALNGFAANGVCRYVVDVRGNIGGDMYPMLNGVKALLGKPPYAYWDTGRNGLLAWQIPNAPTQWTAGEPARADYAEPAEPIAHARIAVLIDRMSVSAGEFTAIAFEGMANVRFFGEPSGGFVTSNAPYALPDGARLMISTGWATDRVKRPYRVAVVPDEQTPPGQPTLDAAVNWLKRQPCR